VSDWFECPCGQEWFGPDVPCGAPDRYQPHTCPICTQPALRRVLCALEAGVADSPFDEADDVDPLARSEWRFGGYRVVIEPIGDELSAPS
jgi:hypothetical protein